MSQGDENLKINKYNKIGSLGLYIIIMGVSLAVIYILWASFGYIGPSFSSDMVNHQQATLRADYGLPKHPIITDPKVLQTPPSLRPFLKNTASNASK